jgi:hypothetical protein
MQPRFARDGQAQGRYYLFRTCDLAPLCSVDILALSDLLRRILAGCPYVKYRRTTASELSYLDLFFCLFNSLLGLFQPWEWAGLNCHAVNENPADS